MIKTLAIISATLIFTATSALAQLPGQNKYAPFRIGTVVVKNQTPTPVWIEFLTGGKHLSLKASYCLMPQETKSNETWSIPGVQLGEERFQVHAQMRPAGCATQYTSQTLEAPAVKTALYSTSWTPPHKTTIFKKEHEVFIEGHNAFTYAIRVVTK